MKSVEKSEGSNTRNNIDAERSCIQMIKGGGDPTLQRSSLTVPHVLGQPSATTCHAAPCHVSAPLSVRCSHSIGTDLPMNSSPPCPASLVMHELSSRVSYIAVSTPPGQNSFDVLISFPLSHLQEQGRGFLFWRVDEY